MGAVRNVLNVFSMSIKFSEAPTIGEVLSANVRLARAQGLLEGLRTGVLGSYRMGDAVVKEGFVNALDECLKMIEEARNILTQNIGK